MPASAPPARSHGSSQRGGTRTLWQLINTPQAIERGSMRLSCLALFVVYAIIVIGRAGGPHHWEFILIRGAVCVYALLGAWLAGIATPAIVRAYTVGLAFVLPLSAAWVNGVLGNGVGEVALTALATFVPLVYLQTAKDFVLVDVGLAVTHAVILSLVPEPELPHFAIAVLLGGAITTGTVAGLQALVYRARWSESVAEIARALATAEEWKSRFEAASLASGQLLYDWDPRSDDLRVGGACDRILGFTAAELSGGLSRWNELVHPDDRDRFDAEVRRVLATKDPFHLQYRMRRSDGRYVVAEDNGYFVLDGDGAIVRLVGFVSDVTERAAAERVRAEEAAISAALAHVGRELISSLETPIVLERLCRLTAEALACDFSQTWVWHADDQVYAPVSSHGLSPEEWKALRLVRIPSSRDTPPMSELLRNELVQVTPATTEYPMVAGLLTYYGFSVVMLVPLYRGGEMIGIQTAGCRTRPGPLTAAQERIARGIAQLASMAWTNARLFEELERASNLKSEFVSTMSHELRTPLNVIVGYTDMLGDSTLDEEQRMLLGRIRHSSLELLEMVEATLDLNRIAAGKSAPRLAPVALAGLWDELRSQFAALPSKAGVELCWSVADGELTTDRQKLKMILKNLIGNALKFTSAGSVVVACSRDAAGSVFTVRDTGIGIPEAHLPHVFDMFRQVDSSDARSYGGTGLGLYIVRQLAQQLGGEVRVESEPGRGSVFTVVLPDAPGSHAAAA